MRHGWSYLAVALLLGPQHGIEGQTPSIIERVRAAARLPEIVDSVRRNAGASESDVRGVLTEHQRRRIPASEAHDVLQAANESAREHGPVDNFGAFVQARLASGLRGQALAQAIRQEHAQRGIGGGRARESMAGKASEAGAKRPADAGSKNPRQAGATTGAKSKGKGRP